MSNLSQKRRAEMLEYLSELKKIHSDDESIRALNAIETALTEKKYGLVWEEHSEKVDEMLVDNIPVFTEVADRKITANVEEGYNFLLEGDNLHSLKLLEKTHKGKIDVIYIDPPYNTGSETENFRYNDNRVEKSDAYRHSKWLSFMNERLLIAKKLLNSKGFLFISIDDNELYQLKMLCDAIFDERKYLATITVETSTGIFGPKAKHIKKSIVKNKDYILCYALDLENITLSPLYTKSKTLFDTHFTWYMDETKECHLNEFLKTLSLLTEKANHMGINNNVSNLDRLMSVFPEVNSLVLSYADNIYRIRDYTLTVPEEYLEKMKNGKKVKIGDFYVFLNDQEKPMYLYPWTKLINMTDDYSPEVISSVVVGDLWKGFNDDMGNIGKEGNVKFPNGKKPVRLIKNILKLIDYKEATVLDFFAGSGTTGHAVAQLNKEDGGNRKYILCTNNENNICEEVTYQRLKNIQEDLPHNLKYFKTDFIKKFSDEEDIVSDRLLSHIKEMVELENMCEMDGESHILILSDEDLEALEKQKIKTGAKIYVPSYVLLSRELENEFERKDVEVIAVPDYYFLEELREVGEL